VTEQSQFADRYTSREAVDEILDSIRESGPSEDEHYAALEQVADSSPRFFLSLARLGAHYRNDQADDLSPSTVAAAVKLAEDESLIDTLRAAGAERTATGVSQLRVALRREGHTQWEDHTPDA
jgi:hypothetical protein